MNRGRTIITRAAPETTDEPEPGTSRPVGSKDGSIRPFLHHLAVPVDGEIAGRTLVTKVSMETTDEESPTNPHGAVALALGGRTITTQLSAETTDEEPRG